MNKKTLFLSALALIGLLFIGGTLYYNQSQSTLSQQQATKNLTKLIRHDGPAKGSADAKVTLVEFFDPACGTCAQFHPFVEDLLAQYPGKLRVMARYAPFHQGSDYLVKLLEASRKQGKFWQALEVMFATQSEWASHEAPQPQKIWTFLGPLGMDLEQLGRDLNAPGMDEIIQKDLRDGAALNVSKTPEFFVNGRPLPRFGFEPLKTLVEEELAKAY
ncbi:MAG: thioredoxin domain-containing protein [Magnetococcales bacterium]|nr:thioredoxin domain-containing protein [Magnetococcales bacterium]